jgi:hypothetical protein
MLSLKCGPAISCFQHSALVFSLAVAALFAGTSSADAGNMLLQIQQGAASFSTTGSPTFVSTSGQMVGDYMVTFAGASSNSPGSDFNAFVNTTTLTVTRLTTANAAPLVISILASDFTLPTGNPLYLGSSASATFTGTLNNEIVRFQSFFDPNNTMTSAGFGAGDASGVITVRGDGVLTDGEGSTAPVISVNRPNAAYALSNITTIDLQEVGSTVNTTGSTEVRNTPFGGPGVVPEPASIALFVIGSLGLAGAGGRRRMRAIFSR